MGQKSVSQTKKLVFNNVLIPWYPVSYLTIASSGFFGGGAYGSLPDAAIWWCLRTGGGGVLTSLVNKHYYGQLHSLSLFIKVHTHTESIIDEERRTHHPMGQ